jgi:hypothetical protein
MRTMGGEDTRLRFAQGRPTSIHETKTGDVAPPDTQTRGSESRPSQSRAPRDCDQPLNSPFRVRSSAGFYADVLRRRWGRVERALERCTNGEELGLGRHLCHDRRGQGWSGLRHRAVGCARISESTYSTASLAASSCCFALGTVLSWSWIVRRSRERSRVALLPLFCLRQELTVTEAALVDGQSSLHRALGNVLGLTAACEIAGAVAASALFWSDGRDFATAVWQGVFTSVSAFCNAGFALESDSLVAYQRQPAVLGVVGLLIALGGLAPAVSLQVRFVWLGSISASEPES